VDVSRFTTNLRAARYGASNVDTLARGVASRRTEAQDIGGASVSNVGMRYPIALGVCVLAALAQDAAHPSFAGHWAQAEQPVSITGRVPFCQAACTIEQTSDTVAFVDSMSRTAFALNGEPTTTMAYAPTLTASIRRTAKWDGDGLALTQVIQSDSINGGKPYTTTARASLAADGRLILEGVRGNQDGSRNKYRVIYTKTESR
jgi:hypothetical protein